MVRAAEFMVRREHSVRGCSLAFDGDLRSDVRKAVERALVYMACTGQQLNALLPAEACSCVRTEVHSSICYCNQVAMRSASRVTISCY